MKRAYILVEGQTDVDFLKKVLAPEATIDVEIVNAGGRNSIASLARSLLVQRRIPVAVFMDADSLNPSVIAENRQGIEELIKAAAAFVPVKVVVVVPTLETCFFVAPEAIERMLGAKVPPELIPLGRRDPKGVLAHLATVNKQTWDLPRAIAALDSHDIERIRKTPPIEELTAFLQGLHETELARSATR
jgi:hypothetical protein